MLQSCIEPSLVHKSLVAYGFKKSHLPLYKMLLLGIMAGVYVGFGTQGYMTVYSGCTIGGACKYFAGFTFATALMMIIGCGAELFTGNCMLVIAMFSRHIYWWEVLFDWAMIWSANFIGCIAITVVHFAGGVNGYSGRYTKLGEDYCHAVQAKANLEPGEIFCRGLGCNAIVCLTVMLAIATKSMEGKLLACLFPIAIFAATGYEHCIANMSFFTTATLLDCVPQHKLWINIAISTLGNITSAVFLSVCYWLTDIADTEEQLKEVPHDPNEQATFMHSVDPSHH